MKPGGCPQTKRGREMHRETEFLRHWRKKELEKRDEAHEECEKREKNGGRKRRKKRKEGGTAAVKQGGWQHREKLTWLKADQVCN